MAAGLLTLLPPLEPRLPAATLPRPASAPAPEATMAAVVDFLSKKPGGKGERGRGLQERFPPPRGLPCLEPSTMRCVCLHLLLLPALCSHRPCPPPPALSPHTHHAGAMTQLGVYLRSRHLSPEAQLKRFLQLHNRGRIEIIERCAACSCCCCCCCWLPLRACRKSQVPALPTQVPLLICLPVCSKMGSDMVQLAEAAAKERAAAAQAKSVAAAAAAATSLPPPPPNGGLWPGSAVSDPDGTPGAL